MENRCLCYAPVLFLAKRAMKVSMNTWWTQFQPGLDKFENLLILNTGGLICLPKLIFCSSTRYANSKSLLLKGKSNTDFSLSIRGSWCSSCKDYLLRPCIASVLVFISSRRSMNPRLQILNSLLHEISDLTSDSLSFHIMLPNFVSTLTYCTPPSCNLRIFHLSPFNP